MSEIISGYFTDLNESSEEHIFIDNDDQPLCSSTEYKKGDFVKTGDINKEIKEEMLKGDSLALSLTCSKCRRMLKDVLKDEFWREF